MLFTHQESINSCHKLGQKLFRVHCTQLEERTTLALIRKQIEFCLPRMIDFNFIHKVWDVLT